MALLKKLSAMLLLISLTALTSCKSTPPKDFPKTPVVTVKQPIVEQSFCDEQGFNCEVKSFCRELLYNKDTEKWSIIGEHPLKFCHGIFGVNTTEYNLIRKYLRDVLEWLRTNIKWGDDVE